MELKINTQEPVIGDLFVKDNRLKLKAVKDVNTLLRDGFTPGGVEVIRTQGQVDFAYKLRR